MQIFVTDNDEAIRVAYSTVSIWEPNPPNDNFFVLGQYYFRTGEPPGLQNKLIVARWVFFLYNDISHKVRIVLQRLYESGFIILYYIVIIYLPDSWSDDLCV